MDFKVGNVLESGHGSVIVITAIKQQTPLRGEPYIYVSYDFYGEKNCSGGMTLSGEDEKVSCSCWYDKWERCYHQRSPDPECENCNGDGEVKVYRPGLKDCKFLAENVTEYKKIRLKDKIEKLQSELNSLD